MYIEALNTANIPQWDDFIEKAEDIPFFFTLQWKQIIEDVFRLKPFYYFIKEKGKVIAVAPFFLVRSRIFGNRLISLPFTDYGGIYFQKGTDLKDQSIIAMMLFEKINNLVMSFKLDYIELRGQAYTNFIVQNGNYFSRRPYVTFCLDLRNPFSKIYNNFSRSIKSNLRYSQKSVRIVKCRERRQLAGIYDIYVKQLRKFGSPPLPRTYFEKEWDILKERNMFEIFLAYYNKQIVAAEGLLIFRKKIYAELIMSNPRFDRLFPKVYLFYETIKWAHNNKFYFYDFGRTRKHSGVYEHKRRWGGEEKGIDYSFVIYNPKADVILDANQKRFLLPQRIFRKLPVFCLKGIGPPIRRRLCK